jgi:predicted hotdog family 3-hydroxylacyl-ACP dehydratase
MQQEYSVEQLVPHSGSMSLLTRIVAYGDDWLQAEVDIHAGSMFAEQKGVPAWVGIEYLAQAVAAFSGVEQRQAGGEPKLGFLLGTRRYETNTDWFPCGCTLNVRVQNEMVAENGLHVFMGTLTGNQIEATARLNVFQPDDVSQYLEGGKNE